MSMANKIKMVITHPSQLSERWVKYYCLDELNKVFDVEFWDCSALAFPSFTVAHPLTPDYLHVIHTLQEFESKLQCLPKDTVLITEVHHNSKTYRFHKIQSKYFPRFAHVGFYGNDIDKIMVDEATSRHGGGINGIKGVLYQSKFIRNFVKWLFHHRDSDYQENRMKIKSAECYTECFEISCVGTAQYRINHPDFEQYLKVKEQSRIIEEPYIVFIDDFFPYHPEICASVEKESIENRAILYHRCMNAFFAKIECIMHCKVVIAAHPYANYSKHNPFEGREIYYGKTAQLVKDCLAVCQHGSNAYSYVALFDKPVGFVICSAMAGSESDYLTRLCGKIMALPVISIDDISSIGENIFQRMNPELRTKYIANYLGDIRNPKTNSELIREYVEIFHNQLINRK